MSFDKSSRLLTHLIALTCFSAFFSSDHFQWGWALFGVAVSAASLPFTCLERRPPLTPRFWNGLSLLFCLLFLFDIVIFSGAPLAASLHFLIYLMTYRLFHLEKSRDERQLYLIGFLLLLAAAGDGNSLGYAISFALSCFLLVWGLLAQHFKAEYETRAPLLLQRRLREVIPIPFFIATNLLSLGALFLTLLIFFLIPRTGIGLFQIRETSPQKISGFSEKVELGSMGPIKLDPSMVMRVIPTPSPTHAAKNGFYLRGTSFDLYDGRAWKNTWARKTTLPKDADLTFEASPLRGAGPLFKETVLLEPLNTAVLFTSEAVATIQGNFQALTRDPSGTFYLPSIPRRSIEYEISVSPRRISESDLMADKFDYPAPIRTHYLSIDVGPKVVALAQEITAPYPTPFQKVKAIERYLGTKFAYSLDVAPSPHPPIEDFLFFQKKGYCEYYATAMVALLRSVGIASRLVTGFLPGEWNEFGKYYLVRKSDAHAWVEVYFPEGGWIPFDPTPAVGQNDSPLFKTVAAYLDWTRLRWDRYIVHYSLLDQFALLQGTRDQVGSLSVRLFTLLPQKVPFTRIFSPQIVGSSIAAFLFFRIGLLLYKRRKESAPGRNVPQKKAGAFYHRMLRILARKGFVKEVNQTPMEFARVVTQSAGQSLQPVETLTDIYCRVRFGARAFSAEDRARVERLLTEIETG